MLLLAVLSIASWTAIFQKQFSIRRAKRETNEFEKQFWGGADLSRLFEIASNPRRKAGAEERIFEAGMGEYLKLRSRGQTAEDRPAMLDGARRAMRAAYQREMDALEARLNFLASVGSVSPYGESCTRLPVCRICSRPIWRASHLALPRRWSRPRSACLQRYRRWLPTTGSQTTSIAWPIVLRASWKNF
jgi:hypothetical protein